MSDNRVKLEAFHATDCVGVKCVVVSESFANDLAADLTAAKQRIEDLEKMVTSHREAVAKFLVPHRTGAIAPCWLEHFEESGMIHFDKIGFVYATPLNAAMRKETE